MKIELRVTPADVRECTLPYSTASYVLPTGTCPHCKADPFEVHGGKQTTGHSTITAPAACRSCKAPVGDLVVTFDTIFGLEEDDRVLHGRHRVY